MFDADRSPFGWDYREDVWRSLEAELEADLGDAGERKMRGTLRAQGWQVMKLPNHRANDPGPDAIAWRPTPDGDVRLMVLDNKNWTDASAASKNGQLSLADVGALTAPMLARSLPQFRAYLGRAKNPIHQQVWRKLGDLQRAVSGAVRSPQANVQGRAVIPVPRGVQLVLTNAGDGPGGRARGITESVRRLGIGFLNLNAPIPPTTATPSPARTVRR